MEEDVYQGCKYCSCEGCKFAGIPPEDYPCNKCSRNLTNLSDFYKNKKEK